MNMDDWTPIDNVDISKRTPSEWAKIYKFKLIGDYKHELISEYEWAYNINNNFKYMPLPDKDGEYIKSSSMELRASLLYRDLLFGADLGEKSVLNKGDFIETNWIRKGEF